MSVVDLYGIKNKQMEDIKLSIESALKATMVLHESSFWGEYYMMGYSYEENLTLHNNFNDVEKDWLKPEFKDFDILLYINNSSRTEELQKLLTKEMPDIVLLHRDILK